MDIRELKLQIYRRLHHISSQGGLDEFAPMRDKTIYEYDIYKDKNSWDGRGYSVVTFMDDGGEIGFGYHNAWKWTMMTKDFNKMVRKYIWIWIKDFFGLRSWLYWKSLHGIVANRRITLSVDGGKPVKVKSLEIKKK